MDKCFACDKELKQNRFLVRVDTESTLVFVGPACYKKIHNAVNGYQPTLGGPRLFDVDQKEANEYVNLHCGLQHKG